MPLLQGKEVGQVVYICVHVRLQVSKVPYVQSKLGNRPTIVQQYAWMIVSFGCMLITVRSDCCTVWFLAWLVDYRGWSLVEVRLYKQTHWINTMRIQSYLFEAPAS